MSDPLSPPSDPASARDREASSVPSAGGGGSRSWKSAWRNPWLVVALLAMALAGWQWVETRVRLSTTQQELARRLAESDTVAKESRALAKQSQEQLAQLQAKLGEVEGRLAESKSQQAALEGLYEDLARSREAWALTEIEQQVSLAAQQLQLAGNVRGAIVALEAAQTRLAGSKRPQFAGLRQAMARDLSRLRALPQVDLPGMSQRLETLVAATDTLALAVDVRPRDPAASAPEEAPLSASLLSSGFWQHILADFWRELRGLVRIQRFDREEPALLAPNQRFFLRENLKLRLLHARLALVARDQWIFRNEIRLASVWVERYFDTSDKGVVAALSTMRQLANAEINIDLPNLNDSLSAIRSLQSAREPG